MDLLDNNRCVVGEAFGLVSNYAGGCEKCDRFSLYFESNFVHKKLGELEATKEQFVRHWNEQHRDVTMSLGKRKPIMWYDSFLRFDDYIERTK